MSLQVAVVGAGLAGLMAARTLADAGVDVTVFDKGRRPGGRASTREHGAHRFDHGAQYFTIRDPSLMDQLGAWRERGLVEEWHGTLVRIHGDHQEAAAPARRYVAVPGMVNLALELADGLNVHSGVRVGTLLRSGTGWRLLDTDERDLGTFHHVIVAVPAAQAAPLLEAAPALQREAAAVNLAPCWATMLAFERRIDLDFDGAFLQDGPFSWMARDSSKPGRPEGERWVIHATPSWTTEHWDVDRAEIPTRVLAALEERFGPLPRPIFERAHRWGYALPGEPVPGSVLLDQASGLGVCGDWCLGGRIEGALLSGVAVARAVSAVL